MVLQIARRIRNAPFALLVPLAVLMAACNGHAESRQAGSASTAPPACIDTRKEAMLEPPPIDVHLHSKTSKTLEQRIDVPFARFTAWHRTASLEKLLKGNDELPGVTGTKPLNDIPFREVGSRRLVCLTDGGSAVEQILLDQPPSTFAYVVWAYTTPQAAAIEYGYGQFWFRPDGEATMVRWQYSFKLKQDRFPGSMGALGRRMFRTFFLDTKYERFMRSALNTIAREANANAGP
jgi:hypothetical protein